MEPTYKISLFLDKRDLGILQGDGSYGTKNHSDWYVNVPLLKTMRLVDNYVYTYMDPFRTSMPRQLINPYFIEYGFFETIKTYSGDTMSNNEIYTNIDLKSQIYNITINK